MNPEDAYIALKAKQRQDLRDLAIKDRIRDLGRRMPRRVPKRPQEGR